MALLPFIETLHITAHKHLVTHEVKGMLYSMSVVLTCIYQYSIGDYIVDGCTATGVSAIAAEARAAARLTLMGMGAMSLPLMCSTRAALTSTRALPMYTPTLHGVMTL